MWYESKMINETLDSLNEAIKYSKIPVNIRICLNSQTYLETPTIGKPEDMFNEFINHPILKNAEIIYKNDQDNFYNIGDWRREQYNKDAKYTVWGESDCLIPEDYFYILSSLEINEPHILSLSSRIMWDDTWTLVEHINLQKYPNLDEQKPSHEYLKPFRYYDYINQKELNEYNNKFDINIIKLNDVKIDGSLLALSKNLPTPFIPPKQNFVREDFCAQEFFKIKNINQYNISTRIKGHNYKHPLKRLNTKNTRSDIKFKEMERHNINIMNEFIQKTLKE